MITPHCKIPSLIQFIREFRVSTSSSFLAHSLTLILTSHHHRHHHDHSSLSRPFPTIYPSLCLSHSNIQRARNSHMYIICMSRHFSLFLSLFSSFRYSNRNSSLLSLTTFQSNSLFVHTYIHTYIRHSFFRVSRFHGFQALKCSFRSIETLYRIFDSFSFYFVLISPPGSQYTINGTYTYILVPPS